MLRTRRHMWVRLATVALAVLVMVFASGLAARAADAAGSRPVPASGSLRPLGDGLSMAAGVFTHAAQSAPAHIATIARFPSCRGVHSLATGCERAGASGAGGARISLPLRI